MYSWRELTNLSWSSMHLSDSRWTMEMFCWCLTNMTNMVMASFSLILKYCSLLLRLASSCSLETTMSTYLCVIRWMAIWFSAMALMAVSICCWSSGFVITSSRKGFFFLRQKLHPLKNFMSCLALSEARRRSSFRMASPDPKSCCSLPTGAMLPPRVITVLITIHILVRKEESISPQDLVWVAVPLRRRTRSCLSSGMSLSSFS
mmetsp:Transcript_976/g.1747  ORF Transcript_976/g.1747 Transcript_976/m.1747 type:complete len:204 (-) Transcript_976:505-1116(-)